MNNQNPHLAAIVGGQPMAVELQSWHQFAAQFDASATAPAPAPIELFSYSQGKLSRAGQMSSSATGTDAIPANSIALLSLSGMMLSRDFGAYRGVQHLTRSLMELDANPNVTGIVLEINSGGGMVTAGQMVYSALAGMKTPVVGYAHLMASGAVMGTLPLKQIVLSSKGAEVGSIGTMITLNKWFAEMYPYFYQDLYAKESTNKNRSFREYLKGNADPYQQEVDTINKEFIAMVQKHRLLTGDARHTLSGEMFFARDAISRGLAHRIGTFEDAVRLTQSIGKPAKIVPIETAGSRQATQQSAASKVVANGQPAKVMAAAQAPVASTGSSTARGIIPGNRPGFETTTRKAQKPVKSWMKDPVNRKLSRAATKADLSVRERSQGKSWMNDPVNKQLSLTNAPAKGMKASSAVAPPMKISFRASVLNKQRAELTSNRNSVFKMPENRRLSLVPEKRATQLNEAAKNGHESPVAAKNDANDNQVGQSVGQSEKMTSKTKKSRTTWAQMKSVFRLGRKK